jgi:pyruvate dehydrogenase complex dehydrogenase (E1) component
VSGSGLPSSAAGTGGPAPSDIADVLFPRGHRAGLVTVLDGHPHTLAFLAALRGDPIRCLGVRAFGQSSSLEDAYALHGIDAASVVDAALGGARPLSRAGAASDQQTSGSVGVLAARASVPVLVQGRVRVS